VLFVIRTAKNPLPSRPSGPLIATWLGVVAIGLYLPFSPLAGMLGFTPLPAAYFGFVAVATGVYLLMVEFAKKILLPFGGSQECDQTWRYLGGRNLGSADVILRLLDFACACRSAYRLLDSFGISEIIMTKGLEIVVKFLH